MMEFTREMLEKALELACKDISDGEYCPYEMQHDFVPLEKCLRCANQKHRDSEKDLQCWKNHYLRKVYNEIMSNR